MPDKTLSFKGNDNKSKERFTVILCSHADGSEKLSPLVIEKS